jgi:DNA-binding transcriptional ArsR family regulator
VHFSAIGDQQRVFGGLLLRIHFTVEDMARLRMRAHLGPVAESVFALDLFARRGSVPFPGWRKEVRARLGQRLQEFQQWPDFHPSPQLLWLLEMGGQPGAGEHDRWKGAAAVFEFCQVGVLPYWERVYSHLSALRDAYGRIEIANGVRGLLGNLHCRLHWNSPVLEAPSEPDRDVYLDGRGLVIGLSAFLHGRTCVVLDAERETGLPALVVAAPVDPGPALETRRAAHGQALSALVGHTRAAALEALTDSCTTGELSVRLGISLAGASKHATVLRKAGLVTTARNRNTALHTLTPLGVALLRNRGYELPLPLGPKETHEYQSV